VAPRAHRPRSNAVKNRELRWESSTWKTRKQWRHWERAGLRPELGLDDLKMHFYDDPRYVRKRVADLDFKGAITSMTVDRTIEGASTVEITLRDPNQRIFSKEANRMRPSLRPKLKQKPEPVDQAWEPMNLPKLIGRAIEIDLDGVVFRLTKVTYTHTTQELNMTFEDRIVYWLRRKKGEKSLSRGRGTRAEFILALLREVKAEKVPFICPELHTKQKIAPVED
jgi:hypothetical protein